MGIFFSTDFADPSSLPYSLWDDPMTVGEFKWRLRLMGKLLREARDTDVWTFISPMEVWNRWPELAPHLGRRRGFWEFLLGHWQREGLIGAE